MTQLALDLASTKVDFLDTHGLTLIIDPLRAVHPQAFHVGEEAHAKARPDGQLIHVMSPHSGGEIRGYWLINGRLHVRLPAYTGAWAQLDEAVAARVGASVVPYIADEGGVRGAA